MTANYTFIYDGECPFCNHFAELLEIKSKLNNIKILDGRKNLTLIKSFLDKGYDLDKGAILLKDEEIFHGADAINTICKQINNCLLYTSPSPRDPKISRMPSSA